MKSILKNKFSVWNKKVLQLPFFRIEFWLLEVLGPIFKESHYLWRLYCRDMAQIEGLDLVYQNHVAKNAAKCRYHEDFRFESRSLVTLHVN